MNVYGFPEGYGSPTKLCGETETRCKSDFSTDSSSYLSCLITFFVTRILRLNGTERFSDVLSTRYTGVREVPVDGTRLYTCRKVPTPSVVRVHRTTDPRDRLGVPPVTP